MDQSVRHVLICIIVFHCIVWHILENIYSISILVLSVFVDCDYEHEDKEDPSPAQKMPDVVSAKEKKVFIKNLGDNQN